MYLDYYGQDTGVLLTNDTYTQLPLPYWELETWNANWMKEIQIKWNLFAIGEVHNITIY